MHEARVSITLLDELVVSERAASEGGHSSLDYLPGSLLLGAVAARLYKELGTMAHTVFHSGKVRFGNGLPLSPAGNRALPMPLAWHTVKDGPAHEHQGMLKGDNLFNVAHGWPHEGKQPKQVRGGYVTAQGELVKVDKRFRMKTAIDANEGRAAEGQLFGYESMDAGTRFQSRITADDDIPLDVFKKICDALAGNQLMGRSRSAQYGEVACRVEKATPVNHEKLSFPGELTLWLVSDLCCLDDLGMPTLYPMPQWLGLPTGELVIEKSFIRTRVVSPYNGHRRSHDMERQVITQGSVLTFKFDEPHADTGKIASLLSGGLGLWRESGLGEVVWNSSLLATNKPKFAPAPAADKPAGNGPKAPDSPLVAWLQERVGLVQDEEEVLAWVNACLRELKELHDTACKLGGMDQAVCMGPGRAQWGRILEAAHLSGNRKGDLRDRLFAGTNAVIPGDDQAWTVRGMLGNVEQTFRAWLEEKVAHAAPTHIALLAKEVQATLQGNIRRPQ